MAKKQITMKDIANRLGVSINAVSIALNDKNGVSEETRKQILDTAEEMGYLNQSSKYLQTYSHKNICVLLKHRFFRDFRFYGRILLGIEEEAKRCGYDVFITSYETQDVPSCIDSKKVSGIIVLGKIEEEFLRRLMEYKLPIVLADHLSLEEKVDCVMSDNKLGSYKMVSYLYERGYRKIGYLGDFSYTPSTKERFYGYLEAIQEYLQMPDLLECMEYVKKYSLLSDVEGYVIHQDREGLYKRFLSIPEMPQALVCSNDELAIMLIKLLREHGHKVPDEIAITGFDDIELGRMAHPDSEVEKLVMGVDIVERDSVGRIE